MPHQKIPGQAPTKKKFHKIIIITNYFIYPYSDRKYLVCLKLKIGVLRHKKKGNYVILVSKYVISCR